MLRSLIVAALSLAVVGCAQQQTASMPTVPPGERLSHQTIAEIYGSCASGPEMPPAKAAAYCRCYADTLGQTMSLQAYNEAGLAMKAATNLQDFSRVVSENRYFSSASRQCIGYAR